MVARSFYYHPQTENVVKKTVAAFLSSGWILLSHEECQPGSYRQREIVVGWPPEKGEPVYPPNCSPCKE